MKILVADNDWFWCEFLKEGFTNEGFSLDFAANAQETLEKAKSQQYDAILVDPLVLCANGYESLRRLRTSADRSALLMLTNKGQEREELASFENGADDYLVKPLGLHKLVARIHAIHRRLGNSAPKHGNPFVLRGGSLELHILNKEVKKKGKPVEVTKTEFILLECLMRRPGQVFSRPVLCQHLVSGNDIPASTNAIDAHMKNIRAKVDSHSSPSVIRTVRGVGYAFAY
jgi:two-component system response regulator MprA